MSYDIIIVDVFNLYYRNKGDRDMKLQPFEQAANCVKFINSEVKPRLTKDGYLYLLYDPIIKSDLGISKKFSYTTTRQSIDPGYKANRHHSLDVQESCRQIYNYYNYRGDHIFNVMDVGHEADDYVEQIIAKYPNQKIALYTTDYDWARYLSSDVVMINESFSKPFTAIDYKAKFGYNPTIASVVVDKALFGDESDNITGALKIKKAKFLAQNIDDLGHQVVQQLADSKEGLNEFLTRFTEYRIGKLLPKKDKNLEEALYVAMDSSLKENVFTIFYDNIKLIKSRCKDVDQYISWHKENASMNEISELTLGLKKDSKKFVFGNVKLK